MDEWSGRRVVILGAARQGTALARYLAQRGAQVTVNDRRSAEELREARQALSDLDDQLAPPIQWVTGGHPLEILEGADLICISGGIPLNLPVLVEAHRRGIPFSNDSQIFLEAAPCKVIGITGSAGKTTTTTLVGRMAQAAVEMGFERSGIGKVWVGGNIGTPLISSLDEMQTEDLAVMELSSFQLEIMTVSPQVSALLNISPNHLDRHGTMEAYTAAKARILDYQTTDDIAVLGRDDPGAWGLEGRVKGHLVSFGAHPFRGSAWPGTYVQGDVVYFEDEQRRLRLVHRKDILLRGEHNLQNVLAACATSLAAGLPAEAVEAGVQGFTGVPHRLQFIRNWGGADWYNDSIATAPERTIAAIRSFDEPLVLLVGGRDKDLPWDEFARLARQRIDHLVVFGEAAGKIIQALETSGESLGDTGHPTIVRCKGLRQAVEETSRIVRPGDVVLLSPGGTSFDEFSDFEERGICFTRLVMQL